MDKTLIEKYLNNSCNDQELEIVLSWFRDSSGTAGGKAILHKIWEELSDNDFEITADFDSILNRIHHDINIHQTELLMENAEYDLVTYNKKRYLIRFLRNVAAILLFPVFGLGILFSFKYYSTRSQQASVSQAYNEVFSSADAITKVTLPDGSNVWLNHSSSLCYPAVFSVKFREVELKGEGFFEVAYNPALPFVVNAGEIQVLARGTTFNIMAYPNENKIETSLVSGNIELRKSLPNGKTTTFYKMSPTDHTIYNIKNNEILTKSISDGRYFSWKEGKLIFTAEPMEEVVNKLSRWFNVEMTIKDPELKNITLTATFVNETLPQVLELIALMSPISYSISDRKKDSSGTFSKRKVILSLQGQIEELYSNH
jgi:ferric-dicitrate binding protein FerR (iron transport regulator)